MSVPFHSTVKSVELVYSGRGSTFEVGRSNSTVFSLEIYGDNSEGGWRLISSNITSTGYTFEWPFCFRRRVMVLLPAFK